MTTQQEQKKPTFNFSDTDFEKGVERSCQSCVKFDACLIWRFHRNAQAQVEQAIDKKPFDLLKTIGKGCTLYLPLSKVIGTV